MKQTLLLLCALLGLCCSGAWGQLTSITDGGLYSIQFSRTDQTQRLKVKSDLTHDVQNNYDNTTAAVFKLTETGEANTYYIMERSSSKYVYASDIAATTQTTDVKIKLGDTTLPSSSDSETASERLDRYKWVIEYIGDKGTAGTQLWTIKPSSATSVYWAVFGQTKANPIALYGTNTAGTDHYRWGFVQLVNPTFESMVIGGCTVSEITSAGHTLDDVAEYYKPTKLDVVGWPTTAAYNTFKTEINALEVDAVVSTAYLTPYQTMCSTYTNPVIGTFYRLKDYLGNYVYATGVDEQLEVAASPSNPMSSVFYTMNTISSLRFMSLLNGYYILNNSNGHAVLRDIPGANYGYQFDHITQHDIGALRIKNNSEDCWYPSSDNKIYTTTSFSQYNTANSRAFYFEEVTSLPVTISTAKYATLCSPVALTKPDYIKVYYISSVTSESATLTEITGTIAANTPVILYSTEDLDAEKTYYFTIVSSGGTDVSASNKLSGQAAAQSVEADFAYTLQKGSEDPYEVGFYPKTAGVINGFKAYLPTDKVPAAAGVKGLSFRFENADGISTIGNVPSTTDNAFYDMSGRRVSQPTHGLYIVGGKKVVIK